MDVMDAMVTRPTMAAMGIELIKEGYFAMAAWDAMAVLVGAILIMLIGMPAMAVGRAMVAREPR
jgi:type IV secretory pathway VirB3-like protein